jgi:arginine metabolism regulation protein II
VLSPRQVDGILKYLDTAEHTLLSSSEDAAVYDHNFAVFASKPARTCTSNETSFSQLPSPTAPASLCTNEGISSGSTHHHRLNVSSHAAEVDDTYVVQLEEIDADDLAIPGPIAEISAKAGHGPTTSPTQALATFDTDEAVADDWLDAGGSPSGSHSGLDLDRFLMRHYAERVCHLFCVVDSAKSPWKTIHLPRALQSMGEFSVTGKTTTVRSALCNALLSISAWYLSNDHYRHQNTELGQRWAVVAAKYGYNAIAMLKRAVASDMYSSPKPKYKEFLASMLSMVTINVSGTLSISHQQLNLILIGELQVMSGDTQTCGVHLDGAGQLISFLWNRKKSLSDKTRSLYSIYCYLRVIYESTLVQNPNEPTQRELRSESVFQYFDKISSDRATSERIAETAMFETIYGIPQRLLAMLEEVTKLVERVDHFRSANGPAHLPDDINTVSDQLENDILDWTMNDDKPLSLGADTNASREIIRNQTRAFHGALIIFFSQHVRLLDHRFLRQDVEIILESIETIEHIKAETNMLAAPIFWPAFIAATEAFDPKQQERFRKWHNEVASYGIASVRTGIDVVNEVWKLGPSRAKRHTSLWRTVVARTGDSLMLS